MKNTIQPTTSSYHINTDGNHSCSPMMVSAITSVNQSSVTHPQLKTYLLMNDKIYLNY